MRAIKLISAGALCLSTVGALSGTPVTAAGGFECTAAVTGPLPNVVVPPGASCVIVNATVNGDIEAGVGSTLVIQTSVVNGNIRAIDAAAVRFAGPPTAPGSGFPDVVIGTIVNGNVDLQRIGSGAPASEQSVSTAVCGTRITGNLSIVGSRSVAVGGRVNSGASCRFTGGGNEIGGNARVADSFGVFFRVGSNTVEANLTVTNNVHPTTVRIVDNTVADTLNCFGNAGPALEITNNAAAKATGQCASPAA